MGAILSAYNPAGAVALRLVYVDAYGADNTGATDSTAAINRAIAALGTSAGNLMFSVGSYTWGASGDLTALRQNQGVIGQGSEVTTFTYTGNNQAINEFLVGTFNGSAQAGKFTGFTLSGFTAGGSAVGLQYGDLQGIFIEDVVINGFGKAGIYGKNVAGWSEQATVRARFTQNGAQYLFDTGSFDYSTYTLVANANSGQDGITLQNGASLEGTRLELRGNFHSSASGGNTGAVIAIDRANASGTSRIDGTWWNINVECDGTTGTGHIPVLIGGGSSCQFNGEGQIQFRNGTISFQAPSITTAVPVTNTWQSGTLQGAATVYQNPQYQASDYGYAAWTLDPATADGGQQLTTGTVYYWAVQVRSYRNVGTIIIPVLGTAASGETAGQNFVGLYNSAGTLLASTGVDSAFNVTFNTVSVNFTSQTLAPGLYWIAFLLNATTMPQLARGASASGIVANLTLTAAQSRFARSAAGQTALPSPATPSSFTADQNTIVAALA